MNSKSHYSKHDSRNVDTTSWAGTKGDLARKDIETFCTS